MFGLVVVMMGVGEVIKSPGSKSGSRIEFMVRIGCVAVWIG